MSGLGLPRLAGGCFSFAALALAGCLLPQNVHAGTGAVTGTKAGPTPFISNVSATYSGGTLSSISYGIFPKAGSLTRPLVASYSSQYLASTGNLQGNSVTIPVFGLYAGFSNSINIYFYFTDGTVSQQPVTIATAAYTDPCTTMNAPALTQQRVNTSDLNFDFFLLKQNCSANNPTLLDTDGNIRWVGQANDPISAVAIFNNVIYLSDGKTGILAMPLTTATPAKIADFAAAPYNVTFTGHHNIDPGRNGLIVDVNTTTQLEAVDLEFNPSTGGVLNYWDLGQIISYTMTKGGDAASKFVLGTSADWFHNNATAYNPADNTLIVSSRENFVFAVDYDTPADGQKKIHWILGDTSKAWYTFPSLRALMLNPANANTLPPIGQHAVSIDHNGYLLLFDDGYQSLTQVPAGNSRTYSAIREYQINTANMTATQGPIYYSPSPAIFNPICGSVYDVSNTFLVDFPTAGATSSLSAPANLVLQGLGGAENLVFNLQYSQPSYCVEGWNAYPIASNTFTFSAPATIPVSLASEFNIYGIVNNGSQVLNGGLDTSAYAYSASLLGTNLTFNSVSYSFGTAGSANAVSSTTLALPSGNYQSLNFVGTAIYGNQPAQTFVVTYTDGSSSTFTQSISDWGSPQSYSGESIAVSMPYRLTPTGSPQTAPFSLYAYSFQLNSAKTVKSFTLPNSRNVTVLAVSLSPSTNAPVVTTAQTITFAPISTQSAGTTANLSGTATSGLPVAFASTTPTVCTVSNTTASFIAAGTCTISASQPGNATFSPAASVSQSFTVTKGSFSLASSATTVTVAPQSCVFIFCTPATSATDTITLTPVNGFTGPVSFTITGVPSGVTASFSASSLTTSGSTKLTLTPGTITTGHSAALTITGTSAAVTASTKITLSY